MKVFLILTGITAIFYVLMAVIVGLTRKKHLDEKNEIPEVDLPSVTVQIPTYNEIAALNCAQMCINFDYPSDKLQIILGDDSSDVEISNQIDNFAQQNQDKILVTRRGNNIGFKPGNLNHMLPYSTGEIILIFDSDFLPKRDFLKKIVKPFINNPCTVPHTKRRLA